MKEVHALFEAKSNGKIEEVLERGNPQAQYNPDHEKTRKLGHNQEVGSRYGQYP